MAIHATYAHTALASPRRPFGRSRAGTIGLWTAQIVAAALFMLAGSLKLTGAPVEVQLFDAIGVGQWFRYLTGTIEVGGAILLLVPSFARFAAAALAATMVGATLTHLVIVGGNPAPAIVLLVATTTIAVIRWRDR
jgi:putative oxidoreductase